MTVRACTLEELLQAWGAAVANLNANGELPNNIPGEIRRIMGRSTARGLATAIRALNAAITADNPDEVHARIWEALEL